MIKKPCLQFLIVMPLALLTFSCAKVNNSSSLKSLLVSQFTKSPSDSVLQSGLINNPVFIADPGVIKDTSGYHLFMTNQFCDLNNNSQWDEGEQLFDADNTQTCVAARGVGATMYAFSEDEGLSWTVRAIPAIEPGPSEWDNYNVETAFPFIHNDILYVLYSAYGDKDASFFQSRYQIGLASVNLNGRTIQQAMLDDNEVLSKFNGGAAPLLARNITTSAYDNNTQEPSVVVTSSGFEVFFTGLSLSDPSLDLSTGNGNSITGIALLRQKFDFNWQKVGDMEIAMDLVDFITNHPTYETGLAPLNIGEVHFYNDKYHIFYTTLENESDFHKGERIAHAVSDDGLTWSDFQVILEAGTNESDFDGWGIMAPAVVFESDKVVLFYSAWGSTTNTGSCVLSGDGAKWGIGVESNTKCVHGNLGRATAPLQ